MSSQLCQFHPSEDLPKDFMLIIYGKRRTGKTTMLLHMLESMKDRFKNHETYVFSGTANCNPQQWKNFPSCCVHTDLGTMNERLLQLQDEQMRSIRNEIKRQIACKNGDSHIDQTSSVNEPLNDGSMVEFACKQKKRKRESKVVYTHCSTSKTNYTYKNNRLREMRNKQKPILIETPADEDEDGGDGTGITDAMIDEVLRSGDFDAAFMPHKLIILDDVVDSDTVRHSQGLNSLAVAGRHWYFTVILLSQCICGSGSVPPIIRLNTDFIICVYNPRSKNERKLLSEQYLSPANTDSDAGLKLLADITRVPFRAIVIDNTNVTATKYRDFIYMYGPTPEPPHHITKSFQMGTESQWEQSGCERKVNFNKETESTQKPKKPIYAIDGGRFNGILPSLSSMEGQKYFNSLF